MVLAIILGSVHFQIMKAPTKPLSIGEFVPMLALTVSLVAMSTDVMLPALDTIGRDLAVSNPNDTQLIVSMLFLGYALGQLLAGPLSDSFGRKPVVYLGFSIFLVGCLMSMLATDINLMLAGRVLQGLGVAGPRVVPIAIVRDGYEGRAMARIMSFIMAVFILVPTLAPLMKKMRMIMPRVAPMVRRMAMSRPLSFTSMIRLEMMLKAATRMISVRIRNMTLRSTWMALKKAALARCQS